MRAQRRSSALKLVPVRVGQYNQIHHTCNPRNVVGSDRRQRIVKVARRRMYTHRDGEVLSCDWPNLDMRTPACLKWRGRLRNCRWTQLRALGGGMGSHGALTTWFRSSRARRRTLDGRLLLVMRGAYRLATTRSRCSGQRNHDHPAPHPPATAATMRRSARHLAATCHGDANLSHHHNADSRAGLTLRSAPAGLPLARPQEVFTCHRRKTMRTGVVKVDLPHGPKRVSHSLLRFDRKEGALDQTEVAQERAPRRGRVDPCPTSTHAITRADHQHGLNRDADGRHQRDSRQGLAEVHQPSQRRCLGRSHRLAEATPAQLRPPPRCGERRRTEERYKRTREPSRAKQRNAIQHRDRNRYPGNSLNPANATKSH